MNKLGNTELRDLLDLLGRTMGSGVERAPVAPGPRVPFKELPNFKESRPLTPEERQQRGIDPRDPNKYELLPDGNVVGTLMGWPGMGSTPSMGDKPVVDDRVRPQQVPMPMIPRANRNGLTRLSPGIYRDKGGRIVRRAKG